MLLTTHNLYISTAIATLHRQQLNLTNHHCHPNISTQPNINHSLRIDHRSNRKAPASPPHHKAGWSRPRWAPCISQSKRATGIKFIIGTLFLIPDSPNPGNMNQQGWLPPCRPDGLRWQGQLNSNTHTRHIFTHPSIHLHFAPKARRKNRKAPASPLTTRAGGADRDGHQGKVKAREGSRRNGGRANVLIF